MSFKGWILGSCLLVVLLTLSFMAVFLQRNMGNRTIAQTREHMRTELALIGEILETHPISEFLSAGQSDRLADRLSARLHSQVAIFDAAGRMIGDSGRGLGLENSWSDPGPEVHEAIDQGSGWSLRPRGTGGPDRIWVAARYGTPDDPGLVVRTSRPLSDLDDHLSQVRMLILWAMLLGILLSMVAAFVLAQLVLRPLRELTRTVGEIAAGDLSIRLRRYRHDELGELGRAVDRMADNLQREIREVTRSRDRLDSILRGMVEGVLVTDQQSRIIVTNRALKELVDLDAYPIGRKPAEIIRNADLIEAMAQVADGAPYASLEFRTIRQISRTVQAEIAPLPGEGERAGVVAVFHDVTERKRIEEMRRDFVANVSHELRTPLAAVKGAVETLLDGALGDPVYARKFTETIRRQTDRLDQLVRDLLELARLESGQAQPADGEIPVEALVGATVETVVDLATAKDIRLETEIAAPGLTIAGERRQLEQAVINLLDNAIKYTEPGGRVRLRVSVAEGAIRLDVSDTGMGIASEHVSRIFERFYRVDKNRSREIGGTGLGLAIVKHVVQAHGGRVEVRSTPGRGSVFSILLPDQAKG